MGSDARLPNLADHLFRQAATQGDKRALVFEGRSWSFRDIADQASRLAGGLSRHGVAAGSRVGLMLTSRPEFIFFQQAICALGAVVVPLNIFYQRKDLAHAIDSCDLEYLVIENQFLDRLQEQGPDTTTLRRAFVLGIAQERQTGFLTSADALATTGAPLDK